jgi:DNA-binding XRE family transcriptional regulator
MTDEELAKMIGTTRQTIGRWKKEYPERMRLLKQGLALDKSIEATEQHLANLKSIRENAIKGK